jgi:hypothetical protein
MQRTERDRQFFGCPVLADYRQPFGGSAMLPNSIAKRPKWIALQRRLSQPSSHVTSQEVSCAALSHARIARTVHKNVPIASANHGVMTF